MVLLVMPCYRSDYIAHFYHEKDVNCVLEEVEDLLSADNYGNKYLELSALCASQSFGSLIYHLAVHLGVNMHISFDHALILFLSGANYVYDKELLMVRLCHNFFLRR